jgi:exosortase
LVCLPAAAVLALYWPLFPKLAAVWDSDPNYSHGLLVPLLSVGFAYQIAGEKKTLPLLSTVSPREFYEGLFQLTCGLLLHLAMWFAHNLFMEVLSLVIVIRGLLLMLGGRAASSDYGFPVLFLLFMAPLPIHWYQPIAIRMQQFVSDVSTAVLSALGVPVYQEGYFVFVPGYTMEVAEACSGLRQLVAILALGVAIGHLSGRGRAYRWLLGLAALPIAVVANCVRVVVSGLILIAFGPEWAEGVFHTLEGLAIIAIAALLMVGVAWGMARIQDVWAQGRATAASTSTNGS